MRLLSKALLVIGTGDISSQRKLHAFKLFYVGNSGNVVINKERKDPISNRSHVICNAEATINLLPTH